MLLRRRACNIVLSIRLIAGKVVAKVKTLALADDRLFAG